MSDSRTSKMIAPAEWTAGQSSLDYLPGAALGLFTARVLGEAVGMPGWWAAVGLSLFLAAIGAWLLHYRPLSQTWPALLLLVYVIYPEVNPTLALSVGVVSALTWVLTLVDWPRPADTSLARSAGRWVGVGLSLAFLALYLATLAPDVLPADSGELQTVAANLGVAHPPGFPLYTVLAHLMTRLPLGATAAYRVNLFSALTAALTVLVVYQTTWRLTRRRLAGVVAGLALGAATTFWSQATTANVRSLTALFAVLLIYFAVRFREEIRAAPAGPDSGRADRYLSLTAVTFTLGLTHHASLIFMGAVVVLFVFISDPSLLKMPRRWLRPILWSLLGLLPLLYLPLRANAGVRGASPDLATWSGFLEHVLATGFRGDLFYYTEPGLFAERLRVMGNVMTFQFLPMLLAGMAIGLALMLLRDRPLALLLGGSYLVHALVTATYRAPQTVEYMLPAYVPAALCLGYGVGGLARSGQGLRPALGRLFAALMLVATLIQTLENFPSYRYLHADRSERDYAETLLAAAPPNGVILAHWHWATPLWYLQEVEGRRPDVRAQFVFPEGEPYADTWLRRVSEALESGPVIATYYEPERFAALPVPEPVGEAFLFSQEPRIDLPEGYTPLNQRLGDAIDLLGYRLETQTAEVGQEAVMTLAWQPATALEGDTALFAHLVGPDGQLYGQQDLPARPRPEGITLTQFRLTARPDTPPGSYVIRAGAYADAPLLTSSAGSAAVETAEIDIKSKTRPSYTAHPVYRRLLSAGDRRLVGYDWDRTLPGRSRLYLHWRSGDEYATETLDDAAAESPSLPAYRGPWGVDSQRWDFSRGKGDGHYVPFGQGITWTGHGLGGTEAEAGALLTLPQTFHSDRPQLRDYVVSVRLIGLEPDGFHWDWWDLQDSIPALGAIPTLKWVTGSTVRSPHRVTVSPEAAPGQALTGALTLYDAFNNRTLPILDERITADFAWTPLGKGVAVGNAQ